MSRGLTISDLDIVKSTKSLIKEKHIKLYMDLAKRCSEESYGRRLKVGCVVVKDDIPISLSWNGTPPNWDNNCEDDIDGKLVTRNDVIHAEENAIAKLAKHGISSDGASIFITHSPCINCSRLIFKSGIKRVFYGEIYRSSDGLNFLYKAGIECEIFPKPQLAIVDIINDGNINIPDTVFV